MKLIKVEMFLKVDDTVTGSDYNWIEVAMNDNLEGDEAVLSFHVENADPSDIGLDSL